jgi:23S rRNA G2069 N7-methylase RlmK/C1962 C5-methylase RlmI
MMIDDKLARIRSTVNNIRRYRRLLETQLTELERQFIERRLAEEKTALDALNAETFPMAFRLIQAGSETLPTTP